MNDEQIVSKRIQPLLDQHPNDSIEIKEDSFSVLLENRNPNNLGNFAGGDMANAAAGLTSLANGVVAQSASINIECVARGDGELLVATAETIHHGNKLIRLRSDVYVRQQGADRLVAIAQINMSPMTDQSLAHTAITFDQNRNN